MHIHKAAINGPVSYLKELLAEDPKLLEAKDENGATPLWWAAFSGKEEIVQYLSSIGANVNAKANINLGYNVVLSGLTPMHAAAMQGHTNMVELLKSLGGDVNATNSSGQTPLQLMKKKGCYIATACYGDFDHPDVITFRRFRDQSLLTTKTGQLFVSTYYKLSPPIANRIGHIKWLSNLIRKIILEPLARKLRK